MKSRGRRSALIGGTASLLLLLAHNWAQGQNSDDATAADANDVIIASTKNNTIAIKRGSPLVIEFDERADATCDHQVGTTVDAHFGRNGALTERELRMAKAAWKYFEVRYQPETGLVNAVGDFPSTTMWDTASYVSALVAAYELCVIDKRQFDIRATKLLNTLRNLDLYKGEAPNKVYHTKTGAKVNYSNAPGEVGMSALDIGRMLVWLGILKSRYPYLANSVDNIPMRWNFCNIIDETGQMNGAFLTGDGKTRYVQEGRLGYEEYAAKGFALWGFDVSKAMRPQPFATTNISDVEVPYDGRDPRVFKNQNYVLTEGYILDGLELGWDLPSDKSRDGMTATDGWRAEFANRIYAVQQRRYEETGIITARSEHQVNGKPFFVYDSIFADGYPWNTLDPTGEYQPDRAAVAAKAAIGLWALWNTEYTDLLFETVADLYEPEQGFYEGLYENGSGYIPLQTANNNGVILAALLYKVQGPILQQVKNTPQVWQTAYAGTDIRDNKCHPKQAVKASHACKAPDDVGVAPATFQYCRPVWIDGQLAATDCSPKKHGLPPPDMPTTDSKACTISVEQANE
jgi:hypothetical protein